jgi:hypothetical protein
MLPVLILLLLAVIGVIVLSIKLCSKRPWLAVIMALGLLLLLAPVLWLIPARRSVDYLTDISMEQAIPLIPSEEMTTSIWLPGIEDQFEADVYPSKLSAVRSLGLHIAEPVRQVFGETSPSGIILFKGAHESGLIEEFGRAITRAFPDANWTIAPETVAVQPDEVGIRIDIIKVQTHQAPWSSGSENEMTSGTIQASVLAADKQASMKTDFVDKPWVENLSGFLMNRRMDGRFIIARSSESCMTEAEANNQAVQTARAQISDMLGQNSQRKSGIPVSFARPINANDILEGGFILDRFVQSFEGTAGKIWRQALLLDLSPEKIKKLAQRKALIAQARKTNFARMFFSIFGLIVLITVVYAFLNAATKGYYVWSLRIAGIVFALVVIILLLV